MREARQRVLERRERAREQGKQGEQEQQSGSWERLQELLKRASDSCYSSAARRVALRLSTEPRVRARVTEADSADSFRNPA